MNSLGLLYTRIGEESLQDLSKNFYLEVSKIPELRNLYPEDLDAAERRIYLFLVQALGGPQTYSEERGHPRLRMRHMPFVIDGDARDRWIYHMHASLSKIEMDEALRDQLWTYLVSAAHSLVNTP